MHFYASWMSRGLAVIGKNYSEQTNKYDAWLKFGDDISLDDSAGRAAAGGDSHQAKLLSSMGVFGLGFGVRKQPRLNCNFLLTNRDEV